ncbi:hypothetical protein RirG_261200 [Rhizophagus irregularis DAOM 197198w]|nr:hypothetical protein RirG_261200 [Rhizophagus irregularis DAOM 197198w]
MGEFHAVQPYDFVWVYNNTLAADLKSHQNMNQRTTAIKIKASIGSNSFDSINKSSLRERKQFE